MLTCAPLNPVSRSICEKCESAFASVTVIFCAASSPSLEDACSVKRLCCSRRARYAFPPTVTACVLHRSVTPELSTQSNRNSGVGGASCSLYWSMVGMRLALRVYDANHRVVDVRSLRRYGQLVRSKPRLGIHAASHSRLLVIGGLRLRLRLRPEKVHRCSCRQLHAKTQSRRRLAWISRHEHPLPLRPQCNHFGYIRDGQRHARSPGAPRPHAQTVLKVSRNVQGLGYRLHRLPRIDNLCRPRRPERIGDARSQLDQRSVRPRSRAKSLTLRQQVSGWIEKSERLPHS